MSRLAVCVASSPWLCSRLPCGQQDKQLADVSLTLDICHTEEVAGGAEVHFLFVCFRHCRVPPPPPRLLCLWISIGRGFASTRLSAVDLQLSAATRSPRQTRAEQGRTSASANTVGELVLRRMANIISSLLIFNVANVAAEPDGGFSLAVLWAVWVLYDSFYTAD